MITLLVILTCIWLAMQIGSAVIIYLKTKEIANKLFPKDKNE